MTTVYIILSVFGGASLLTLVRGWSLRRTRKQIVEHRLTLWRERERMEDARKLLKEASDEGSDHS